jgi:hypothetical protein
MFMPLPTPVTRTGSIVVHAVLRRSARGVYGDAAFAIEPVRCWIEMMPERLRVVTGADRKDPS